MWARTLLRTLEDVFETYRMLGQEREAELSREAARLQRAADVRHSHPRRSIAPLTALARSLLASPFVSTTRREQKPA